MRGARISEGFRLTIEVTGDMHHDRSARGNGFHGLDYFLANNIDVPSGEIQGLDRSPCHSDWFLRQEAKGFDLNECVTEFPREERPFTADVLYRL